MGGSSSKKAANSPLKPNNSDKKKSFIISKFKEQKTVSGKQKEKIADKLNATAQIQREKFQEGLDAEPILKDLIKLPEGETLNDWLEINTIHFFNISSVVYGSLANNCTENSCPHTKAGNRYEYFWVDGSKYKEPTSMSAKKYMTCMFDWIEEQITNPAIFPTDDHGSYPANFEDIVRNIFRKLFRMYAHVYYHHFDQVKEAGAESQLNSTFQHLAYFVLEYQLVDDSELRPLRKLIGKLVPGYRIL